MTLWSSKIPLIYHTEWFSGEDSVKGCAELCKVADNTGCEITCGGVCNSKESSYNVSGNASQARDLTLYISEAKNRFTVAVKSEWTLALVPNVDE